MPSPDSTILRGTGVSSGIVIGQVLLVGRREVQVSRRRISADEVATEVERFEGALDQAKAQLEALRVQVVEAVGEDSAQILDSHLMLVEDQTVTSQVKTTIEQDLCNAEHAFEIVLERYIELLSQAEDRYIRERLADIRDVGDRILSNLQGGAFVDLTQLTHPAILVAHDLAPSDTAAMDRQNVLGFVTALGSRTSHTAIMARAMGIPAVVGLSDDLDRIAAGDEIIVDGAHGTVIVNPSDAELSEYRKRIHDQELWFEQIQAEASLPAETIDGFHVRLAANIELPEEVDGLKRAYGVGIGLFRTEFLFLKRGNLSEEEPQFRAYREVAEKIYPQSVIFRTLDIGGDKFISHLDVPRELNPFLGMRAIRFSLSRLEIFHAQLRAILRASAYGKVRIMFPMISTLEELLQAREVLEKVKADLKREGIPHNAHLDVGIMIEVPAAALLADKLAPHVDFFSLGTNDLVQYSLAVDRSNPDISYLYQPSHPSIIQLIRHVVEAAYNHGKWVGICGEMAAEPLLAPLVLGMGIHELSMSPVAIGPIKRLVRHMRMYEAEALVAEALGCGTAEEVLDLCREFLQRVCPEILPS
jgi:phosphotransferase system enzyme I (PtsI)